MTTTQARTDIHRPSAEEFDPQLYKFLSCIDFQAGEYGAPLSYRQAHMAVADSYLTRGYKFAEHVGRSHNCGHCGANLRYAALMARDDAKELIYIGETCLDHRFDGLTKAEFAHLRKMAQLDREKQAVKLAFNATCEQYPAIAYATYAEDIIDAYTSATKLGDGSDSLIIQANAGWAMGTLCDIARKARQYGTVSAKQAAFAERLWNEIDEKLLAFKLREIAKAADPDGPAPRGRKTVTAEVISVKDREGYMGGTEWKMTVLFPNGSRAWGTVPSILLDKVWDGTLKGTNITFTASFEEPRDGKVDFAIFKRPVVS